MRSKLKTAVIFALVTGAFWALAWHFHTIRNDPPRPFPRGAFACASQLNQPERAEGQPTLPKNEFTLAGKKYRARPMTEETRRDVMRWVAPAYEAIIDAQGSKTSTMLRALGSL
jgi:hypothetical protein